MERESTQEGLISELGSIIGPLRFVKDEAINDFADKLRQKYGVKEVYKYRLFQLLGGSSEAEGVTEFDFPGEDSIESFIRSL